MSDNIISPDQLAAELNAIMQQYVDVTDEALKKATDETAKETVKQLKRTSPKDTGAYANAWTQSKNPYMKGRQGEYGKIVHVKAPHYRLTHLLEYGHATRNGGRTAAQPHIRPAADWAVSEFESDLIAKIRNGGSQI